MKSRLYLPKFDTAPQTILDYLVSHFPQVQAETWHQRISDGKITQADGSTVTADSPYRHGITILYSREVPEEPSADAVEEVLYRDANILVVDKPHGMVVTPAGDQVERSLLVRLQKGTGLATLAPIHRLDRETAGVVLFAIHPDTRGLYHRLFSGRMIEREYLAIGSLNSSTDQNEWLVKNRLEEGEPWFRRRIASDVAAADNAITRIEWLESRNGMGLFRLRPETGKKHQLRVHMAAIGFPIVGDLLYPVMREKKEDDPPLQLLASRLSFDDPLSGEPRSFTSKQKLLWAVE